VGPLSNVAVLFMLYPEAIPMVEVVIMGGCLGVGNTGPVMEFNMQVISNFMKPIPHLHVHLGV
jgi:inosine-uridine nucleoside N-ribohydrolase